MGVVVLVCIAVALIAAPAGARERNAYIVTPLVSNNGVTGTTVDPHLVNGWGLDALPTSPWWVSDNGADLSTLYNAAGTKIALEVGVPGGPTGLVANPTPGVFLVAPNAPARFIFSTLSGTIRGWNPAAGGTAVLKVDNSGSGAVYTGLAIAMTPTGPRLYAADFANGRVDVFDGAWAPVAVSGGFFDRKLPSGYAPFGIQTIVGPRPSDDDHEKVHVGPGIVGTADDEDDEVVIVTRIFVAYAKVGPSGDEQAGRGLGFVDAYDMDGNLVDRVARHGALNAPWGIALAPANFGRFSGDLLVGNFGDGHINAYEEREDGGFSFRGQLRSSDDGPITIDGLWALQFGHGAANNGPTDTLFFTAGPNDENDGLFGMIRAA